MPDASPLQSSDPRRLGAYELIGRLGEGGQGMVYLGRAAGGEQVAVKLLRSDLAGDESARMRFVREVTAAKQVARFCTAQVIEADVAGDRPYIVSEFVPGPSLYQQVAESGPRGGADLERLAIGTVTALVAIHQAGIVHRDFKPHNVLMGPDGPRVIDFGIARALDMSSAVATAAIGTPAYMAPEQVMGRNLTPAVDIFAWASTMVYAATGTSPFGQDTIPAVIHRILNEEPNLDALPDQLRELVRVCLAKEPEHRPQARELLMRLLGQPVPQQQTRTDVADALPTAVLAEGVNLAGAPTGAPTMVAGTWGGTGPGASATAPIPPAPFRQPEQPGSAPAERRRGIVAVAVVAALAALVVLAGAGMWALGSNRGEPPSLSPEPSVSVSDSTTPDEETSPPPSRQQPQQQPTTTYEAPPSPTYSPAPSPVPPSPVSPPPSPVPPEPEPPEVTET